MKTPDTLHWSAIVLALLLLGGCTTQRASTAEPGPGATAPAPPIYPDVETRPPQPQAPSAPRSDTSVATLALLRDSAAARDRGDTAAALAYVERAIRLEPRRADLWIELAKLQLPDKPVAAERYAKKALSLAKEGAVAQRDAWLVIADAKQARGDEAAANAIRDRYRTFKG